MEYGNKDIQQISILRSKSPVEANTITQVLLEKADFKNNNFTFALFFQPGYLKENNIFNIKPEVYAKNICVLLNEHSYFIIHNAIALIYCFDNYTVVPFNNKIKPKWNIVLELDVLSLPGTQVDNKLILPTPGEFDIESLARSIYENRFIFSDSLNSAVQAFKWTNGSFNFCFNLVVHTPEATKWIFTLYKN